MSTERDIHVDVVVPNKKRYLSLIGNIAEEVARAIENYAGDREALAYHLNVVLTEAMANAIDHSNPTSEEQTVRVCIFIEADDLCVRVYDQGAGFDLGLVPEPDPEMLLERGRGLFLIRQLMDEVSYTRAHGENILEMHKRLSPAQ